MQTRFCRFFILILLIFCFHCIAQDVKRGRNEGTCNIPASNVAGNGNIIAGTTIRANFGKPNSEVETSIYGGVGIAGIFQFNGNLSIINLREPGTVEAHCLITLPKNDGLRFFGAAVSADLYLSTALDTITGNATSGRPDFHSYLRFGLIMDQDWIALNKHSKLKTYQLISSVDDPNLLFQYEQIAIRLGTEWKTYKHSYFIDAGLGLYKEMKNNNYKGDPKFNQQIFWIEPGIRLRVANRHSFLTSLRLLLVQRVKPQRPLPAQYVSFSLSFIAPIYFKETNTEAIRTLVFINNQKAIEKDRITRNIEQGKVIKTDYEIGFEDLAPETSNKDLENQIIKKREEIQYKMNEIEKLLEDLE